MSSNRGVVPADPFIMFLEQRGKKMRDVYVQPTSQFRWMKTGRMTVAMAERLAAEHGVTPWAIWGWAWNCYDPVVREFPHTHDVFCQDGYCVRGAA